MLNMRSLRKKQVVWKRERRDWKIEFEVLKSNSKFRNLTKTSKNLRPTTRLLRKPYPTFKLRKMILRLS